MQETHAQCEANIDQLLVNIMNMQTEMTSKLHTNPPDSTEEMVMVISELKNVRLRLAGTEEDVQKCLNETAVLASDAADLLTPEEFSSLARHRDQLRDSFHGAKGKLDAGIQRLSSASDVRSQFDRDAKNMREWMVVTDKSITEVVTASGDQRRIRECKDRAKDITDDVVSRADDVRGLQSNALRVQDELLGYVTEMAGEKGRRKSINTSQLAVSVKDTINDINTDYKTLSDRCDQMNNLHSTVDDASRRYLDMLSDTRRKLSDLQRDVSQTDDIDTADAAQVQRELDRVREKNQLVMTMQAQLADLSNAGGDYVNALEGTGQFEAMKSNVDEDVSVCKAELDSTKDGLTQRANSLQTLLTQSQGVKEGLQDMNRWLQNVEDTFDTPKDIPLETNLLEEQKRKQQVLQADLDSRGSALKSVQESMKSLLMSSPSTGNRHLAEKLAETQRRYDMVQRKSHSWANGLNEASQRLDQFHDEASRFDKWVDASLQRISSPEFERQELALVTNEMNKLRDEASSQEPLLNSIRNTAQNLLSIPHATETGKVREAGRATDIKWKELREALRDREKDLREKSEQYTVYQDMKAQSYDWLDRMEDGYNKLSAVALDSVVLEAQLEQVKPLVSDHAQFKAVVERANKHGTSYDAVINPTSGKSGEAPDSKRARHERSGFSPSSTTSSGISSFDNLNQLSTDDLTAIQKELLNINQRYELLGRSLLDRETEIESTSSSLLQYEHDRDGLQSWVDGQRDWLRVVQVPLSKKEAEERHEELSKLLDDIKGKRVVYDSLKSASHELTRLKKPELVEGLSTLVTKQKALESDWESVQDECRGAQSRIQDSKSFHANQAQMSKWLDSKQRMLSILGPVAADPVSINNQLQQIQLLQEEFGSHEPMYDQLKEEATSLSTAIDNDSEEAEYLADKIHNIDNRWHALKDGIQMREKSLKEAENAGTLFFEHQQQLRDWLSPVSEKVNELSTCNPCGRDEIDQHVAAIESIDAVLESKATELEGLQVACEQLSALHTDPSVRNDVQQRLHSVKQPYDELKRKLSSLKGAAAMAMAEGQKFDTQLDDVLTWVTEMQTQMDDMPKTSADRQKLELLKDNFDPVYNQVLNREGELSLIKAKGIELQNAGAKDAMSLQIRDKVNELANKWPQLLTDVKNKKSTIDSTDQLEEQWQRAHKHMVDCLNEQKHQLDNMLDTAHTDANAADSEKRLQQVSAFRLHLDSIASDYKSTVNVGEQLVHTADVDTEQVQDNVDNLSALWDQLNEKSKRHKKDTDKVIRKWNEFRLAANDVDASLQNCAEMTSRPEMSDPKNIGRLRAALEDLQGPLKKKLNNVEETSDNIAQLLHQNGSEKTTPTSVKDTLADLESKYEGIEAQLTAKLNNVEGSETLARQLKEEANDLGKRVKALEGGLQEMGPPARDPDHLQSQLRLNEDFMQEIEKHESLLDEARAKLNDNEGTVGAKEAASINSVLDRVDKELSNVRTQAEQRGQTLNDLDQTINQLLTDCERVHSDLLDTIAVPILQEGNNAQIGGDMKEVNLHLADVRKFKDSLDPLANSVNDILKRGQSLVKSAAPGVETSYLESEVNKLGDAWNELQSRVSDREKQLDMALLGLGNYKDSLNSLQGWLEETEDMVADLPPPSADGKVVKAQLDQQKLVQKLIDDKQTSVQGFTGLSEQMEAMAGNDADREHFRHGCHDVNQRYDKLASGANDRKGELLDTLDASEDWLERLAPFSNWIDGAEKRLQTLNQVPTDEDKLKELIQEHQTLHGDIEQRRDDMNALMEAGDKLASLVGPKDASELDTQMTNLANRYDKLGVKSTQIAGALEEVSEGVQRFHEDTKQLAIWLDDMQDKLNHFDNLSIYPEELAMQIDDLAMLAEEITEQHPQVVSVVEEGRELCMNTTGDEAVALQGRLDGLKTRYSDLCKKADKAVVNVSEANQLASTFHENQQQLTEWLNAIETDLIRLDEASLEQQHVLVRNMEEDISAFKPVIEQMNVCGTRLAQLSNDEGANALDDVSSRLNTRFDGVCEQVQRRGERLNMAKQRSNEIMADMDDLISWFREAENRLGNAGAASADPDTTQQQLKDQKLMNEDIHQQRAKGRELQNACKKMLGDFTGSGEDSQAMQDSADVLKELANLCGEMSAERLALLEQALPLAVNLHDDLAQLHDGIGSMETELENAPAVLPGAQPESLRKQQEHNKTLVQSLLVMKPVVDKFDKTAQALAPLCNEEDALKVQDCADGILARYDALKDNVKLRGLALDDALQESSQFSDKLDGMLSALGAAAEQIRSADPVSAVPEQIRGQIQDNCALMDELEQKSAAFQAVKDAADEILSKASPDDPAVKDIDVKMNTLDDLWDELQRGTEARGRSLTDTLGVAERFWDELQTCINAIKQLKKQLETSPPPACEPKAVMQQQHDLEEIKSDLDVTAEHVDACAAAGRTLLTLVGEQNQPEIEQRINELDQSWDTVTSLYHRRFDNLLEALERAMLFHDTLRDLLDWLENAEDRVTNFNPVTSMTLDEIRAQMEGLDGFRGELEEKAVKREQLTQEGIQLVEGTHPDQAVAVRKPLQDLSKRWDGLNGAMNNRHRALEKALLEMGHFEQAYDQLLDWIAKSKSTLDDIKPAPGDLRQTEIELAKHKVLQNDVFAHQTSVDTLNDAGRRLMSAAPEGTKPEVTQQKLDTLNEKWVELKQALEDKLAQLQAAKAEAESFGGNISKWIGWLDEIDAILTSSKPTGGLPETATEQLDAFMEVKGEMEEYRGELEASLNEGQEYVSRADENRDTSMLNGQVDTLRKRWQEALVKAQDRQKKLEIAMRDAQEFHTRITDFSEWLAYAEQTLNAQLPVSRLLDPLAQQMTAHKSFQDDVQVHRDLASELQTRGTKLQYYCDKKDAIPIKNLLVSAKHRFDKVVSRSADRTKILDQGFQEAQDFYESYDELVKWMDERQEWLDGQTQNPGNNPERIKELLATHKDFQHELAKRQPPYDSNLKAGKQLRDHAPKEEQPDIQEYVDNLRNKWNALCNGAVDRQRKLEEALLFSGQFNEAVDVLIEWLKKVEPTLTDDKHVMGDLDTVQGLVDQHKNLKNELKGRANNVETVRKAAKELVAAGGDSESQLQIAEHMKELDQRWSTVNDLADKMEGKLDEALSEAEKFHKGAHTLLEWLGDMESKLKMSGALPDSESELSQNQDKLKNIMEEFDTRHFELDETVNVGRGIEAQCHPDAVQPMKRWMTILQSRWDEVSAWAKHREDRLKEQMEHMKEQDFNLDQLLAWVAEKEQQLSEADEAPTPEDLDHVQRLIDEHGQFEEELREKQGPVDEATKGKRKADEQAAPPKDAKGKKQQPTRKPSKHPKAQQLVDRWRQLWLQSMERQRKLQDLLAYLRELKRLEKFSFDEWRKRYMDWMNNKKWRVMDFFRRQDKDGDGRVTRQEFVEGILACKFPTTRLEMNKVADIFDKGDGFIDYREFIAALKPDRMPVAEPATDSQRIKCEVVKQVEMCTCPHKYRIREVGEGRYTFGEQAKLRLVRILRSTVMVRVGGGWEALDEFLVKNDPCRAKGRTNIELREKFILPEGVTQAMHTFKSRRSPMPNGSQASSSSGSHNHSAASRSTPGPITKVRQKTDRSVPMHSTPKRPVVKKPAVGSTSPPDSEVSSILSTSRRSSNDLLTPSDAHGRSKLPRGRGSSTSGAGSRPSSRGMDDRPPSRAGSDISEASSIQSRDSLGPTRIPSLRGRKGQRFPGIGFGSRTPQYPK